MVKLVSRHIGKGFPLLILHGLFGSSANWTSMAREFAKAFEVFALDQRNHGGSPHSPVMTYDAMASDVAEFIADRHIERAHLLGHSMGGKTVMRLAQQSPELVDRLVVVDIAPNATDAGLEGIVNALRGVNLDGVTTREEVGYTLSATIPDRRVREFLLTNLHRDGEGRMRWKLNLEAIAQNYPDLVGPLPEEPSFSGPTLFVRGGRSTHLRIEGEAYVRQRFSNASFATIEGAGHWVHAEAPGPFLRTVREFLTDDT